MVQIVKIKRSTTLNSPASLPFGELAVGDNSSEVILSIGNNSGVPVVVNKNRITRISSAISITLTKNQGILPGVEVTMSNSGLSVTLPTVGSSDDGLSLKIACSASSIPFSILPNSGTTIDGDSNVFMYSDEYISISYEHSSLTWRLII